MKDKQRRYKNNKFRAWLMDMANFINRMDLYSWVSFATEKSKTRKRVTILILMAHIISANLSITRPMMIMVDTTLEISHISAVLERTNFMEKADNKT